MQLGKRRLVVLLREIDVLKTAQLKMHLGGFQQEWNDHFSLVEVILPFVRNVGKSSTRHDQQHDLSLIQRFRTESDHLPNDPINIDPGSPDLFRSFSQALDKRFVRTAVADEEGIHVARPMVTCGMSVSA
jgi:hypothetical protein